MSTPRATHTSRSTKGSVSLGNQTRRETDRPSAKPIPIEYRGPDIMWCEDRERGGRKEEEDARSSGSLAVHWLILPPGEHRVRIERIRGRTSARTHLDNSPTSQSFSHQSLCARTFLLPPTQPPNSEPRDVVFPLHHLLQTLVSQIGVEPALDDSEEVLAILFA